MHAIEMELEGAPTRVMRAEHLRAIALESGRVLQSIESGTINGTLLHGFSSPHSDYALPGLSLDAGVGLEVLDPFFTNQAKSALRRR